jgi:hypothetical protein
MEERMDIETVALKLQETTDRSIRNEGRIKKLEDESTERRELATAVAVMAEKVRAMAVSVDTLNTRVCSLEDRPAKKWDGLMDKIILTVAAGVVGFVLAQMGIS